MNHKLDIIRFYSIIYFTFEDYEALYSFVNDNDSHIKHIESYKKSFEAEHEELGLKFHGKIKDLYFTLSKSGIQNIFRTFSNHMLAVFVTHLEQLFYEYFYTLFRNSPLTMYKYVNENPKQEGMVPLKLIARFQSYDVIVLELSQKAAKIATKGNYKDIINRIENNSKHKFPKRLLEDIYFLFETRNKIVHESAYANLDIKKLRKMYKDVIQFIVEVGKAFKSLGYEIDGDDLLKMKSA